VRAIFVVLVAVVGLGVCGCSKKAAQTASTSGTKTETQGMMPKVDSTTTSSEAVPMSDVPETPIDGLSLAPFFDEAGTKTEIAVAPGEQFKVFVMAHTVEHKLSSIGKYDFNYMIAYDCTPPGRFVVVSYVMQADKDFKGGKVEVLPGFLSDNATFLGFATCEFMEVRASGGIATIKLKA
jgi:uncharacterized protein YceK